MRIKERVMETVNQFPGITDGKLEKRLQTIRHCILIRCAKSWKQMTT